MEFDFALAQDIGTRSEQQDSAAVCPFDRTHGALLVIADGLGGHTGGARASHIAVKTFAAAGESGRFKGPQDRFEQLGAALQASNDEIAVAARVLPKNETMGTTLVAAAAAWNTLGWISVGDSHLYLWRAGSIAKLNEDHSQAGQMLKSGRYKADDPELDAYRSMLRSAVMGRELTLIDRPIETKELEKGDILVLATDGLNVVDLPDVESIVTKHAGGPSEDLAAALLDAVRASEATSRDNATVIVAKVLDLDREDAAVEETAESGAAAAASPDAVEEVVTTAIVTTPFFKAGRPVLNVTRRLETQPIGLSVATRRHEREAGAAAPEMQKAYTPSFEPATSRPATPPHVSAVDPAPETPGGSRRALIGLVLLVIAACIAGAAVLAYQRSLVP